MLQPVFDALMWWETNVTLLGHIFLDTLIIFSIWIILGKIFLKIPLKVAYASLFIYLLIYWFAVINFINMEGASHIDWQPRIFGGMPMMMAGGGGVPYYNHIYIITRVVRILFVNLIALNTLFYLTSTLMVWFVYKAKWELRPYLNYFIFLFLEVIWLMSIDWTIG